MAATDGVLVVLDAGPLIHLDELSCLYLLDDFATLLIPSIVWQESIRHRPQLTLDQIPNAKIRDPAGPSPLPLAPLPSQTNFTLAKLPPLPYCMKRVVERC